jgi:hypothetical protein
VPLGIQIRDPSGLHGSSVSRSWQQKRVHKVSLTQELWKAVKLGSMKRKRMGSLWEPQLTQSPQFAAS